MASRERAERIRALVQYWTAGRLVTVGPCATPPGVPAAAWADADGRVPIAAAPAHATSRAAAALLRRFLVIS
jgi:hypothetical protein